MTARLSARQRRVLGELAHMRVPREDAWLTTVRLAQLVGCTDAQARDSLLRLNERELVTWRSFMSGWAGWRITDAGREAL